MMAGIEQNVNLLKLFKEVAPTAELSDLEHYDLVKFSIVMLKIMPDFDFSEIIRTHIHRQKEITFNMQLSKDLIKVAGPFKEAYLNSLQKVKLIDKETAFQHAEILDRIELTNILLDETTDRPPSVHLINSLYFTCLLKNMSLFFFRSRHLFRVLDILADTKPAERDFWIKSEDYVLRVKT